ncbi:ATP-binding protein [Clostridium botulinum A2B7 92]|uniref:ATP-binding cassette domain-containing protein n=1 Tax=Clostridium botulinum TaxID=1491 RepID=UPI0007DE6E3F|nr:ATP-binding cassette domain-containing protein [Clostridium botulinum]KEJ01452.1 ATP-binding protein [Clostridium botulinum A2B7 92]
MTILLNAIGICKDFREKTILNNVNFDLTLGERVELVGLNGAGKSTLANIIYGNIKPDKGNVFWHKKKY